jgi:hypothetical protein
MTRLLSYANSILWCSRYKIHCYEVALSPYPILVPGNLLTGPVLLFSSYFFFLLIFLLNSSNLILPPMHLFRERPQRIVKDKCIEWMWLNECMYVWYKNMKNKQKRVASCHHTFIFLDAPFAPLTLLIPTPSLPPPFCLRPLCQVLSVCTIN